MSLVFYSQLAASRAVLPEAVATEAYRLALEEKDTALLSVLALRPDAPASTLESSRTSRKLEVRGAYYARTGTPSAVRLAAIGSEKAQGALLRLVEDPQAHPEALRAAVGAGGALVCAHALMHAGLAPAGRRDALVRLDDQYEQLSVPQGEALEHLLAQHTAQGIAAADAPLVFTSGAVLRWALLYLQTSPEERNNWERQFVTTRWDQLCTHHDLCALVVGLNTDLQDELGATSTDLRLLTLLDLAALTPANQLRVGHLQLLDLHQQVLDREKVFALLDWFAAHAPILAQMPEGQEILADVCARTGIFRTQVPRDHVLLGRLVRDGVGSVLLGRTTSETVTLFAEASSSADENVLDGVVATLPAINSQPIVGALLANPACTKELVHKLIRKLPLYDQVHVALERFPDALTLALLCAHGQVDAQRMLSHVEEDAALLLCVEELATLPYNRQHTNVLLRVLRVKAPSDRINGVMRTYVENLPAETLLSGRAPLFLGSRAAKLLGEALGEDPLKWETYRVFAKECTATFGELLDGVVAVSS